MNKIYKEATIERFYRILKYLITSIDENDKVVYLVGSTYKTYKNIEDLSKDFNIEIIKIKSSRTGWLKIVPIPVSKDFIIKLRNKEELIKIVELLEDHVPIEIFIFDKNLENNFLKNFNINNREYTRSLIIEDPEYLIYGMDFDNIESSTGALEFISFGNEISNDMKWFF